MNSMEALPCPFCSHERILVLEEKQRKGALKGSYFTYCYCPVCGTRGPWAYSLTDDNLLEAQQCIDRWNERNGVKQEKQNRKKSTEEHQGDNCPHAKLTSIQVKEIRSKLDSGHLGSELAKEYDICPMQISRIKNRKRWNHLE